MVILKASHIVKPADRIPDKVIPLSECDQFMPLNHTPTIYFYRSTSELLKNAVHIQKDSLGKALVTFYPLAGRLHWTNGGRVELHCNSMGALLLEAESELKIDDFGDFCPSPVISSLIPSADYYTTPIQEVPLVLVQLTKLSCGGISLGLAVSHIVADGLSALRFVSEWTKIARGTKYDDDLLLDRTILQSNEHQSKTLPALKYSDFYPLPLLVGQSDTLVERKKGTTAKMIKLNKEQVEKLKKLANQDPIHKTSNQRAFSRFETLSAHLWRCISMARMLKPEQETVLFVLVDFRNRLKPPLPQNFFGNGIMAVPVRAIIGDILSKSLKTSFEQDSCSDRERNG